MNRDEIYAQGAAAAWQELGADCNHYTAACWGLAAVMKAAGRPVAILDVSARWHYPLASADQHSTYSKWLPLLVGACEGMEKPERLPFEVRGLLEGRETGHFTRFYDAQNACRAASSSEVIDKQAAEFIDREIKRKYPKTRRNTKRYRELADSVREKARGIIADELREAAQAKLVDLRHYLAREDSKLCRIVSNHVESLGERVADLRALAPESQTAAAIEALADQLRERLDERKQSTERKLAELSTMLAATAPEQYRNAKAAAPGAGPAVTKLLAA